MTSSDLEAVVELQRLAFPPPFSEDLHWDIGHLARHLKIFPRGQWIAKYNDSVVGSCSNTIITEQNWQAHESWFATAGGPELKHFSKSGSTLYGLDITVHPDVRRQGIGRAFYSRRFSWVRDNGRTRFGTGCRLPDYNYYCESVEQVSPSEYAMKVVSNQLVDRTLTPLLRSGLRFIEVVENYMEDIESGNAAALLEWVA